VCIPEAVAASLSETNSTANFRTHMTAVFAAEAKATCQRCVVPPVPPPPDPGVKLQCSLDDFDGTSDTNVLAMAWSALVTCVNGLIDGTSIAYNFITTNYHALQTWLDIPHGLLVVLILLCIFVAYKLRKLLSAVIVNNLSSAIQGIFRLFGTYVLGIFQILAALAHANPAIAVAILCFLIPECLTNLFGMKRISELLGAGGPLGSLLVSAGTAVVGQTVTSQITAHVTRAAVQETAHSIVGDAWRLAKSLVLCATVPVVKGVAAGALAIRGMMTGGQVKAA
jgi:hypothetical protein